MSGKVKIFFAVNIMNYKTMDDYGNNTFGQDIEEDEEGVDGSDDEDFHAAAAELEFDWEPVRDGHEAMDEYNDDEDKFNSTINQA
ncbi:hypothetical protein BDQ17DRAFT_1440471 [Cyathus striatus]|nr:hypothetical protein BDQ17DRAFT_1440471 [Cyathus striatus]